MYVPNSWVRNHLRSQHVIRRILCRELTHQSGVNDGEIFENCVAISLWMVCWAGCIRTSISFQN
jgi:hypothetical protein